ncbi:Olfactomedin-4, partial [Dissostichus eleginoides]
CSPEEPPAMAAVVVMVLKQLCLGRTAERIVMRADQEVASGTSLPTNQNSSMKTPPTAPPPSRLTKPPSAHRGCTGGQLTLPRQTAK